MLGHKMSLNRLKKTEIISNIFSDHNGRESEIDYENWNIQKHVDTEQPILN